MYAASFPALCRECGSIFIAWQSFLRPMAFLLGPIDAVSTVATTFGVFISWKFKFLRYFTSFFSPWPTRMMLRAGGVPASGSKGTGTENVSVKILAASASSTQVLLPKENESGSPWRSLVSHCYMMICYTFHPSFVDQMAELSDTKVLAAYLIEPCCCIRPGCRLYQALLSRAKTAERGRRTFLIVEVSSAAIPISVV